MIVVTALLLTMQTVTPPEARRPPDERLQNHGQNVVVKHDPAGKVDIVAEDVGACPGPGPTTIMRLRSADKDHTLVVLVERHVNVAGRITTTTATHTLGPLALKDLGCLAEPAPGGGKPASTSDWTIVSAHAQSATP